MEECCVICHDQAMIPVHYTCFGCDCHDLSVSCRTCAHSFLGLNKKPSDRKFSQKCLYCEKTCDPRSLKIKDAYSVDKMMMKTDKSRYDCTEACGFKGDQLEILSHLRGCPKRFVRCGDCEDYYTMDKKEEHTPNCSAYKNCPFCPRRIKTTAFKEHVVQVHGAHHCRLCKKESMLSPSDHKANECTYRGQCQFCDLTIRANDTEVHYKIHRDYFEEKLACLELLVKTMIDGSANQNVNTVFQRNEKNNLQYFRKNMEDLHKRLYQIRKFLT